MSSRLQQLARAVTVLGDQSRGPARTVDAVSARIDGAAGIISAMPDVPERGQALSALLACRRELARAGRELSAFAPEARGFASRLVGGAGGGPAETA